MPNITKESFNLRINKYLAMCGIGSRRACEKVVLGGRVKINDSVVLNLATEIDVSKDKVMVDSKRIQPILKHLYVMMHKPKGCITTMSDEKGRKTVVDYLPSKFKLKRVFPIGRLDFETEGLLLLTTDGSIANKLMHPSSSIPKTYVAKIEGDILESELEKLRSGIMMDGEKTKPCKVRRLDSFDEKLSRIEVVITEGRNRQVRRMFEFVGKTVVFLKRTAIGDIKLGGLSRGECRELKIKELDILRKM